jgi:hypothetical protein
MTTKGIVERGAPWASQARCSAVRSCGAADTLRPRALVSRSTITWSAGGYMIVWRSGHAQAPCPRQSFHDHMERRGLHDWFAQRTCSAHDRVAQRTCSAHDRVAQRTCSGPVPSSVVPRPVSDARQSTPASVSAFMPCIAIIIIIQHMKS